MEGGNEYATKAEEALQRADDWANRDGHFDNRDEICARYVAIAQVYATLAVAQEISRVPVPGV